MRLLGSAGRALLAALIHTPHRTVAELQAQLGRSQQRITDALLILERHGLVSRQPRARSTPGRHPMEWTITEHGRAEYAQRFGQDLDVPPPKALPPRPRSLGPTQMDLLDTLIKHPALTARELGAETGREYAALSQALHPLLASGCVEREWLRGRWEWSATTRGRREHRLRARASTKRR